MSTVSSAIAVNTSHAGDNREIQHRTFGDRLERGVMLVHRWFGIIGCLLLLAWFVSGVVISFVRYPQMSRADKLAVLKPLDWRNVRVGPNEALKAVGLKEFPRKLRLVMSDGAPVYRITMWNRSAKTVSAVTGEPLAPVSPMGAVQIIRNQLGAPNATLMSGNLLADQWTIGDATDAYKPPFDRVALNDLAGTQYYVVADSGEIVQRTTREQRFWNYFGAIPHWTYVTYLRGEHYIAWTWTEYIIITFGVFIAVSGFWIGIKRIRLRRGYSNGKSSPFSGWKLFHHITGILGGVFIVTWTCTAMLAMTPDGFLVGRQLNYGDVVDFRGSNGPVFPAVDFAALQRVIPDAKRVTFSYVGGAPVAVLDAGGTRHGYPVNVASMQPLKVGAPSFIDATKSLDPNAGLASVRWLEHGDDYWHSAFEAEPTPIVRATFSDGLDFYIDPSAAQVVGVVDHTDRVFQWTERLLHDIDWMWLVRHRVLWIVVLFITILPGVIVSATGIVIGIKRLRRKMASDFVPGLAPALPGGGVLESFELDDGFRGAGDEIREREPVLVSYATQTGVAGELATSLEAALSKIGMRVSRQRLADLTPDQLARERMLLCVISTSGEGEPPDDTVRFRKRYMGRAAALSETTYALMALGDSEYPKFCGFGLEVDAWLRRSGAKPMFKTTTVDRGDSDSIDQWVRRLERALCISIELEQGTSFSEWKLVERTLLNTGSVGGKLFQISLEPEDTTVDWVPGDIARVYAGGDWSTYLRGVKAPSRDYSIASLPKDGRVILLVRLMCDEKGHPGVGSGWLCTAPIGTAMALRIRSNPAFHPAPTKGPAIFVGNGTGYAGIRAHLKHRVSCDLHPTWLFFGERNQASDYICRDDVEGVNGEKLVTDCDLAFSRDQSRRVYVQDLMRVKANTIREWVASGSAIYVCGSRRGMAPGVHKALEEILGDANLALLTAEGRYRRDVY